MWKLRDWGPQTVIKWFAKATLGTEVGPLLSIFREFKAQALVSDCLGSNPTLTPNLSWDPEQAQGT